MIVIIDYGCGNPASIRNMLKKVGHASIVSSDQAIIEQANQLILPGVGSFDHGMRSLEQLGLIALLNRKVLVDKTPILGICLGVQLFCFRSEEGQLPGLGWIDANVNHFDRSRLNDFDKVPHMGWSDLKVTKGSRIFAGQEDAPRFYFVHSYHLACRSEQDVAAMAVHGYEFTAAVEKGNIAGVQFHPEKSHRFGMTLLDNFVTNFSA